MASTVARAPGSPPRAPRARRRRRPRLGGFPAPSRAQPRPREGARRRPLRGRPVSECDGATGAGSPRGACPERPSCPSSRALRRPRRLPRERQGAVRRGARPGRRRWARRPDPALRAVPAAAGPLSATPRRGRGRDGSEIPVPRAALSGSPVPGVLVRGLREVLPPPRAPSRRPAKAGSCVGGPAVVGAAAGACVLCSSGFAPPAGGHRPRAPEAGPEPARVLDTRTEWRAHPRVISRDGKPA